ncbi:hypothetical protein [Fructobacillus americanaquae]|uniref:Phage protein n=1 Tax=Fructobacillus americanaquae TaxID=2940302 RepID=A0ABY5BZR4_9LACO|nr:hypothetical protein [Fructobacillus americanaquae]USS92014.1 hypothetical protein M3M36_06800 [Fructobacillus americanaquae]
MTKKFTEEEYQKIVEIADKRLANREYVVSTIVKDIYVDVFYELNNADKVKELNQELALISIPKSRDWAHEQFVEKEKKYYWRYKKTDEDGDFYYLIKDFGLIILDCPANWHEKLTETEIIEAGYNPDMFEREEVE